MTTILDRCFSRIASVGGRISRARCTNHFWGELLEDRCVPASFRWKQPENAQTNNWSDGRNWQIPHPSGVVGLWADQQTTPPPLSPGTNDQAVFDSFGNTDCRADVSRVASMDLFPGFNHAVALASGTEPGADYSLEVTNSFRMYDGIIANVGDPNALNPARGELRLTGSSLFIWSGGLISRTDVVLGEAV